MPHRRGAVTPKAPKRSEGAAEPLDGGSAAWPSTRTAPEYKTRRKFRDMQQRRFPATIERPNTDRDFFSHSSGKRYKLGERRSEQPLTGKNATNHWAWVLIIASEFNSNGADVPT
jgi:hypothetical protein